MRGFDPAGAGMSRLAPDVVVVTGDLVTWRGPAARTLAVHTPGGQLKPPFLAPPVLPTGSGTSFGCGPR